MSEDLSKFEHLVVLMMENRSFDNVLGYLYGPGDGKRFEGVEGHDPPLSNPVPPYAKPSPESGGRVTVGKGHVMDNPCPDPGEDYPHVNTQIYGEFNPPANRGKSGLGNKDPDKNLEPPWNVPQAPPASPPMSGFVRDYIDASTLARNGEAPTYDQYRVIMDCFPPEAVPVLSTLARSFAVCDHWFCAVPSETFPNRAFFNAGTSGGQILNSPFSHWLENETETIFNRIEECNERDLSWGVYFDAKDIVPLTLLLHFPKLKSFIDTNFHPMETFFEHVAEGELPSFAFVEPRLFLDENSAHPPYRELGVLLPSSVTAGEKLISEIYRAIRSSDSGSGSNYQNTLFCITFDEHGGCFDHVPPPAAVPPEPDAPAGQLGFRYDRLGLRVPTVFVSAWIEEATIVNTPLQHCSIIKTVCDKWDLPELTNRDRSAPNVGDLFTAAEARDRATWPLPTPREETAKGSNRHSPLNRLQSSIVHLIGSLVGEESHEVLAGIETVEHALHFVQESWKKLRRL